MLTTYVLLVSINQPWGHLFCHLTFRSSGSNQADCVLTINKRFSQNILHLDIDFGGILNSALKILYWQLLCQQIRYSFYITIYNLSIINNARFDVILAVSMCMYQRFVFEQSRHYPVRSSLKNTSSLNITIFYYIFYVFDQNK